MRRLLLILCLIPLTGCVTDVVAGHFRAASGEVITIQHDGSVGFAGKGTAEFLGVISEKKDLLSLILPKKPLKVLPLYPNSPGVGPEMTFSAHRKSLEVDWGRRLKNRRPKEFRKE